VAENPDMFNTPIRECKAYTLSVEKKNNEYRLWHERLGHISKGKLQEIKRNNLFGDNNLLDNANPVDEICNACLNGKQARLRFEDHKKNRNGAKLDRSYWGEAVLTATFLTNRIPTMALDDSSKTLYSTIDSLI